MIRSWQLRLIVATLTLVVLFKANEAKKIFLDFSGYEPADERTRILNSNWRSMLAYQHKLVETRKKVWTARSLAASFFKEANLATDPKLKAEKAGIYQKFNKYATLFRLRAKAYKVFAQRYLRAYCKDEAGIGVMELRVNKNYLSCYYVNKKSMTI